IVGSQNILIALKGRAARSVDRLSELVIEDGKGRIEGVPLDAVICQSKSPAEIDIRGRLCRPHRDLENKKFQRQTTRATVEQDVRSRLPNRQIDQGCKIGNYLFVDIETDGACCVVSQVPNIRPWPVRGHLDIRLAGNGENYRRNGARIVWGNPARN